MLLTLTHTTFKRWYFMLSCFLNLEFLRTVVAGDQVSSEVIADLSLRGWTFYKADPRLNSASFLADIFLNSHTGKLHAKTPSYCDILNAHSHFYLYSRKTVHSKVVTLFRRIPVSQILESRKCNKSSKDGNEAKKHDVRWEANSVSLPSNLPVSSEIFRITDFFPLSFGTGKEIKFVLREPRSPGYLALNQKRLTLHVARALNTAAWWFPRGFVANVLAKKGNKVIGNKQFNIQVSDNSLKIKGFDESVSKRPHGRSRARRDLSSPKFPRASYSTDVPEDASIGHTVLALTAQSPGGKIRYSMSSARSSRSERLFGINPDTGVITVREKLDRDEGDPQHDFQVKATLETDNLNYGSTLVTIVITDVNDNKPVFEKTSYSKSVNEMFPPGNQLLQVRATDKDKDRNGQVKYSIDNPSGVNSAFSIDSTYGSIRLRKQLDREVTSSYTLRIKAEDNGDLKKSSVVTVTIIVLDDNDNSPQFSKFPYRITIPEDTAINSVIETIHAEDKDEGNNKIITYSMVGHYLSTFSIHPSSGELRLKKSLDYENRWGRSFALHVRATDGGQPQRMNQTVVHIRVTDVNDNPPVFRTRNMVVTVPEYPNTQVDSVIFRGVHADDRDEGNNGKVVYSLGVVPSNFPFAVNPDNGLITATGKLDYEKNNVYRFEVVARDKGNPPKEAKADVTVKIQNINDNPPLFQKQNYQVNITEDTRPESSIFGVTATDKDEPVNPNFQYSITGGDTMGCFQIDFTGTIYLKCPLNYDQQPSYRLTLKVTDQSFVAGGKTLSSTASLVVKVLDANTNTPEFTKTSYSCDVKEGEPVGSLVCKVSASDGDTGENAKITYSIEGNDNYFSIDPNTGDIKVAKLLDREKKFSHSLTVRAADHGVPQLIAFTFVLINVKDINDNAPVFGSKEYTAEIPENIAVDREVIQVSASDQDFGGNREIEYSFAPFANGNGSFKIDQPTGTIRTAKKLDRETIAKYDLIVFAHDRGTPRLNSSVHVKVKLKDIRDSPPVFHPKSYNITINENIAIRSMLVQVKATSADEGSNANIVYLIQSGSDGSFEIDVESGEIENKVEMDYEKKNHYRLEVRARSGNYHDTAFVDIYLKDMNDNAPEIQPFQVFLNIYNDTFPTEPLFKIPAEDKDASSVLKYTVTGGRGKDFVSLNSKTGMLSLKETILNTDRIVEITVQVEDGEPAHKVSTLGEITGILIDDDMIRNSIGIILNDTTRDEFLTAATIAKFKDAFAKAVGRDFPKVYLLSINPNPQLASSGNSKVPVLQVSVAVKKTLSTGYVPAVELRNQLFLNRELFTMKFPKNIIAVDNDNEIMCGVEICLNYQRCSIEPRYKGSSSVMQTKTVIFRGVNPEPDRNTCSCSAGFQDLITKSINERCNAKYSLCYSKPCGKYGRCINNEASYKCVCDDGYTGKNCEINMRGSQCPEDSGSLCKNGGKCHSKITGIGIECKCRTSRGTLTPSCELTGRYFPAGSFASFPGLKNRWRLRISLEFATQVADGVLFYNGRYSEKKDFIAIRIHRGQVELVFSLGEGITTARSYVSGGVSDGKWKKITVVYDEKVGQIAVGDDCSTEIQNVGKLTNYKNYCAAFARSTESLRSLDATAPMFIGGLPSVGATYRIPRTDFIGCIRNIYIDHNLLDLYNPLKQNSTRPGCPVIGKFCSSNPCANGGKCYDGIGGFKCVCQDGFVGKKCENDVTRSSRPVRFSKGAIIIVSNKQKQPPPPWTTSIVIRTRQSDGVLIHEEINGKNGNLKLVSGYLTYYYNTIKLCNLSQVLVSDGRWHHVEVTWSATGVKLAVDYGLHHVTKNHDITTWTHPHKLISLGGIWNGNTVEQGFDGCMQGIFFSGQSIATLGGQSKNLRVGCQTDDPCSGSSNHCSSNGVCMSNWGEKYCKCEPGYVGPTCESICNLNPCKNRGTCSNSANSKRGYICQCRPSFTGEFCETKIVKECADGFFGRPGTGLCGPCNCPGTLGFDPTCNKTTGVCYCKSKHYRIGDKCEPCDCGFEYGTIDQSCDRVTGQCRCKAKVTGLKCDRCVGPWEEITSNCVEINTSCPKSYAKKVWWNRASLGTTRRERCPSDAYGNATRFCDRKYGWQEPNLLDCTSNLFMSLKNQLRDIKAKKTKMSKLVAYQMAMSLEGAINSVRQLYGNDIRIGYSSLSELIAFEGNQSKENLVSSDDESFVPNMIKAASRLFDTDTEYIWFSLQTGDAGSAGLMEKMEKFLTILAENFSYVKRKRRTRRSVTTLPPYSQASKNIYMELQPVNIKDSKLFEFPKQRHSWIAEYPNWKNSLTKVHIPSSIFNPAKATSNEVTVGLMLYQTLGELLPPIYQPSVKTDRPYTIEVYSEILTLTVPGVEQVTSNERITLEFYNKKHNNQTKDLKCVFWNYTLPDTISGGWSTEGCETIPSNGSKVTCRCDHLTSFSLIKITYKNPPKSGYVISMVTYISVAASMAFLLFAFLTFLCLSQLRSNANSIHKNLCAALFLTELVFIVGISRTVDATVCRIIAILIHYFFNCVFSWLFIEALHMYRMLVEKRNINYGQMTFYYFIGWGAPVIIVGVTAGLSPDGYGNDQFCWISTQGQMLWTFTAPIMAIVGTNFLVFMVASCLACQKRNVKDPIAHNRIRFSLATSSLLLPILGAMFVVGLMSVNTDLNTFHYLFAGFAILQGLYIVLFHIMLNREVRNEYINAYIRWKTGDKAYGKVKQKELKRRFPPPTEDNSYRARFRQLTNTFNLSTSTTDSSSDGRKVFGGRSRRKEDRQELSTTQPDSSDSSDEEETTNPGVSETVPSDSSDSSEDEMPGPQQRSPRSPKSPNSVRPANAVKSPDWKLANQKKLRTAPLYASDGPMHSTPSDNSDGSDIRNKNRWQRNQPRSPMMELKDISVITDEISESPEDPLLTQIKKLDRHSSSSGSGSASEVSSLPSVIKAGAGGRPQSILKKKSKYGNVSDSDSDRKAKVRVRVTHDAHRRPLLKLDKDNSEIHDSQV